MGRAILKEGIDTFWAGDVDTGKEILNAIRASCKTQYFALSGLELLGMHVPGRCPGLRYSAPSGRNTKQKVNRNRVCPRIMIMDKFTQNRLLQEAHSTWDISNLKLPGKQTVCFGKVRFSLPGGNPCSKPPGTRQGGDSTFEDPLTSPNGCSNMISDAIGLL